jgi:uncharacterized RDD family membrane protein YckC
MTMTTTTTTTSLRGTVSGRRAGFFLRALAALIDLTAVTTLSLLLVDLIKNVMPGAATFLFRLMSRVLPPDAPAGLIDTMQGLARGMLSFALVGSIYFLSEVVFGRALGKLVLRLRVDTAEPEESPLSARLLRYAAKQASMLLLLIGAVAHVQAVARAGELVAYLTVLGFIVVFSRRRQALHDLVAGTAVFRGRLHAST